MPSFKQSRNYSLVLYGRGDKKRPLPFRDRVGVRVLLETAQTADPVVRRMNEKPQRVKSDAERHRV